MCLLVLQLKMTPLHWAVEKGHLQAIQILIKQGSDINCENKVSVAEMFWNPKYQVLTFNSYENNALGLSH